ncbi:MAG TPA: hypothetical protein VE994_16745 [Terriglobales bacterium]|nr:hypothetical protein [Terriglobales bacterium]
MTDILAQFGIFLAAMVVLAFWSVRRTRRDRKRDASNHEKSAPVARVS